MCASDKNKKILYETISSENILSYFPELSESRILTAVGGGGKTTFLNMLAQALSARQQKTLLTTTTHILRPLFVPEEAVLEREDMAALTASLQKNNLAACGIPCNKTTDGRVKWASPSLPFLEKIASALTPEVLCKDSSSGQPALTVLGKSNGSGQRTLTILCEGDGSKRLPVKIPGEGEPVFFPETDAVVGLIGLSCLHKPVREVLFRRELLPEAFPDFVNNDRIGTEFLYRLALSEKGLKKGVGSERFTVLLNQADLLSEEDLEDVCRLAEKIRDNGTPCHVVSLKNTSF